MASEAEKLGKTGERMVPELHKGKLIYAEHLIRYLASQQLVDGKVVLDIACGSGYGTSLLAKTAKTVYGVDIDADTVAYAQKHYGAQNITFKVGDGERIPLDDNSVDVVVTYETIEHIPDYKKFMKEVSRVLRPDGLAIVSTPNDLEFAEGNHYHLHEFTEKELVSLVKKDFKYVDSYYQATWKHVAIGSATDLNAEDMSAIPLMNYAPVKPEEYLYFFLLCSNRVITEIVAPLAALGEHYSDRYYIGKDMQNEKNIADYKTVLNDRDATIESLHAQNAALSAQVVEAHQAIRDLRASKAFRIGNRLASIKRKIKS